MAATRIMSPRAAALQILAARYGSAEVVVPPRVSLADFQREAVARANAILQLRRGVLIADSVGLGKTFVALALIEAALGRGERVLVVVPACLRRMWRSELRRLESAGRPVLISHTGLIYGAAAGPPCSLVVVDEAHAFRNGRTRRYRALRAACRGARVVLLTATPVNNTLSDLYFQLRLFAGDAAFRDVGVGSLGAVLRGHEPDARALERIKAAVMVRRTRADVRVTDGPFRFPLRVNTHSVRYDLAMPVSRISELLGRLSFVGHQLAARSGFAPDLLRFALLKRLDSSSFALRMTLGRQIRFYEQFLDALGRGRLLRPGVFRSLYDVDETAVQLVLEDLALEAPALPPDDVAARAAAELDTLRAWDAALRRAHDAKAEALIALLQARPPHARTVVFSEYRDTARYLWRLLRRRFPTALLDGAGAWIGEHPTSRGEVIEQFAPADHRRQVHPRDKLRVLVATDILAEGANLQEADAVVSYDLPWNPVRLVQRAGRIDRMGSPHDEVHVYNFLPDRDFDAFLGLAGRLRSKLEMVRTAVGLERPVLEPEPDFETFARALAADDPDVYPRIEGSEDVLHTAYRQASVVRKSGCVSVAALAGVEGRRHIVGLERQSGCVLALVDSSTGGAVEGSEVVLGRALEDDTVRPVDAERCLAVARAYAARLDREGANAALGTTSPQARLARLVRRRMAELPLNETSDVYARADRVLEQLAAVANRAVEDDLELVLQRSYTRIGELLFAAEKVLSEWRNRTEPEGKWRVLAVIVTD